MTSATWAIACVTIERPAAVQRFVHSARRLFPDVPIYIADQSRSLGAMAEFYTMERVTVIRMPYDAGLSASRNALVEAMDVDYFALCDDDFVLGPCTTFLDAIQVLEQDKELAVVGGMLHDYDGVTERIRNWEMFFDYDEKNGRFTATPIYNYPPAVKSVAGRTVFFCDAVMNFAVFRRSIFSPQLRWDEGIKINGEHEDFYLNLKVNTSYLVAYLPTMAALHCHGAPDLDYSSYRKRDSGRRYFMEKWRLVSHLEIGFGGRPLEDTPVGSWFAGACAHEYGEGSLCAVGRPVSSSTLSGISHGVLYSATGHSVNESSQDAGVLESFCEWLAPENASPAALEGGQALFAYEPEVHREGRLLLWCRASSIWDVPKPVSGSVRFRWYSSEGDVLVWESETYAIHVSDKKYWQTLEVRLPLWPKGAEHLRFVIVSDSDTRVPLASGFVYPKKSTEDSSSLLGSPGVLAWCRTALETAGVPNVQKTLKELLQSSPRMNVKFVRRSKEQLWVTMDVSGFSVIGMCSPQLTGASFVVSAGLGRERSVSVPIAIPLSVALDPESVLWGIDVHNEKQQAFSMIPQMNDV